MVSFFLDIKNNSKKLLFFLLIGFTSMSQSYNMQWVDATVGLNQLSVRFCVQDNDGFVWIATELGLYRYDGKQITPLSDSTYPEISKKRIQTLVKDKETGYLYFITDSDWNTYIIKGGKIERIANQSIGIFFTNYDYLGPEKISKKCIATLNKNDLLLNDKFNFYKTKVALNQNYFYTIDQGSILCIDYYGFETKLNYKLSENAQLFVCDNKTFCIDKNKIVEINRNKIAPQTIAFDQTISNLLEDLLTNKHTISFFNLTGNTYINSDGKIYKFKFNNNKLIAQFLFDSRLQNITSINYSEVDGIYLIGTTDMGLAICKPQMHNTFLTKKNHTVDSNYTVFEKNDIWYSYTGWNYNYKSNKSKINEIKNYNGNMRFLLRYKDNYYYEAKNKKLVSILDLKTIAPIKYDNRLNFFTGYCYVNNQLWLSTEKQLCSLEKDSLVINTKFNNTAKSTINSISNFNNKLVIATVKGVYLYNPLTNKTSNIEGLEQVNARYIKKIDKNSMWIGCYGDGLYLIKNNLSYKVFDKNLDLTAVHAIEEDKLGNLWISTNNGLLTINKNSIIKNTLNRLPIECYKFTVDDGLLTNEFNGGSTNPSLQSKDGIIGFPSMKGFVWFNPIKLKKHFFKGNIIVDNVIVDDKIHIKSINNIFNIDKNAKILKINFKYGYHFNRDNLTISYRFKEQKKWITITGNSFQFGRYKKGTHKLLIRITTHGINSDAGVTKTITLNFEPKYFETTWFWLLIVVLSLSLLIVSYRIGLYLNKNRALQLQSKIDEKTAELSKNILQLETSKVELENSKAQISKSLHEKDILLKEVHHRVKNNLQLIMSMLSIQARRKNYSDIHEFLKKGENRISAMSLIHQRLYQNEEFSDRINIQLYIEDLVITLNETFEDVAKRIQINVNADNVILNLSTAIPLGLIVNELVTNALKHGFPDYKKGIITIVIKNTEPLHFELMIEDNGIGFNKDTSKSKSFGLELISLLTAQLNGTIVLENNNTTKATITFQEVK